MAIKEKDLPVSGSYGPGVYVRTVNANGVSQKTGYAEIREALEPPVDSALSTSSTNAVQNKVITGAVNDLKEDINTLGINGLYFNDVSVYQTITSTKINSGGVAQTDANSKIVKYEVHEGDLMYLKIASNAPNLSYRFQTVWNNGSSNPESPNYAPNILVGDNVAGEVDNFVIVPTGAKYLLTMWDNNNTTNLVKVTTKIENIVDDIAMTKLLFNGDNIAEFDSRTVEPASPATITFVMDGVNKTATVTAGAAGGTNKFVDVFSFICPLTGKYRLSGCPVNAYSEAHKILAYFQGTTTYDYGNGVSYDLVEGTLYTYRIIIDGSYSNENNIVFNPSVVYVGATDATLTIPYKAADAYETGVKIRAVNDRVDEIIDTGDIDNIIELSFLSGANISESSIIKFGNGKVLLVDTMSQYETTQMISDLTSRNINHIDYLVLSHFHFDHVGGVPALVSGGYIDANTICYLAQDLDTTYDQSPYPDGQSGWETVKTTYATCMAALNSISGIVINHPTEGQQITIGGCTIEFVNTDQSYYYGVSDNYNDFSLCFYLFNGFNTVFYSGDIGTIAQSRIADTLDGCYKVNVYKSDHHGWNGLNASYINRISPEVVISEDSDVHVNNGYIDSFESYIQSWCECNGVPHYLTIKNGKSIDIKMGRYAWKFDGKYSRYIRGTNHKNWAWVDNNNVYQKKILVDADNLIYVSNT